MSRQRSAYSPLPLWSSSTTSWRRDASGQIPRRSERWRSGSDPWTAPSSNASWGSQTFIGVSFGDSAGSPLRSRRSPPPPDLTPSLPRRRPPSPPSNCSSPRPRFLPSQTPAANSSRGGRCIRHEHWRRVVSAGSGGSTGPPGRLPVPTLLPDRTELRRGEPGAPGCARHALEEWRHWLEGAQHPVLIWTDHKNLTYILEAKRLGPRQARWALLFSCFNFTLTYWPGSKNVRADALSRLFSVRVPLQTPNLNPSFPRPGSWGLSPGASSRLSGRPSVATSTLLGVPVTASSSPSRSGAGFSSGATPAGSPARMSQFIWRRFWWPTLEADVREFFLRGVRGLRPFVHGLPSHRPPGGTASTSSRSRLTIVPRGSGLCHRSPYVPRQQYHLDHGRPVLEDGTLRRPP